MGLVTKFISEKLEERKALNSLRTLKQYNELSDFCSNDYLGFARSPELKLLIHHALLLFPDYKIGSTGSRLISGNDEFTEQLESKIAAFHKAEACLIFNSGYDANIGLFSCLPQRGDTLITDELIHASIIDGARLSYANRYTFKHNDLNSLEDKLKAANGRIFIAVESIYSMDGDEAPLKEIIALSKLYNAAVIVDEAHATGIFGTQGRGLVEEQGLENDVFARIITFGKAMGCHSSGVIGSSDLRRYLINFARSFIYSTASNFYTHLSVKMAYQYLEESDHQVQIQTKILRFKNLIADRNHTFIESRSAIQSLVIGGNERTKIAATFLMDQKLDVRPILHPTVPEGKERLRICLHTFNSDEELEKLTSCLKYLI